MKVFVAVVLSIFTLGSAHGKPCSDSLKCFLHYDFHRVLKELAIHDDDVKYERVVESGITCFDVLYGSQNVSFGLDEVWACEKQEDRLKASFRLSKCYYDTGEKPHKNLQVIEESSLNVFDWYLSFESLSIPLTLVSQTSLIQEELGGPLQTCLVTLLDSLKRKGTAISHKQVWNECGSFFREDSFPMPKFYQVEPRLTLPPQIRIESKNHVERPNFYEMGLSQIVAVFKGRVDVVVCHRSLVSDVFYPMVGGDGEVVFQSDPFTVNKVKFPKSELGKSECAWVTLDEDHYLFVPRDYVFTTKTKASSILVLYSMVNEFNRHLVDDMHGKNSLGIIDKFLKTILSDQNGSFEHWQRYIRLRRIQTQFRPNPPQFSLQNIDRTSATLKVEDGSPGRKGQIQVEWRAVSPGIDLSPLIETKTLVEDLCDEGKQNGLLGIKIVQQTSLIALPGLISNMKYATRMRMVTAGIVGPWTEWAEFRTKPQHPPLEPKNVKVTMAEKSTCVQLSWDHPENDGGYAVKEFMVLHNEDEKHWHESLQRVVQVVPKEHQATKVCNLRPGRKHRFKVLATNQLGVGPATTYTQAITLDASSHQRHTEPHLKTFGKADPVDMLDSNYFADKHGSQHVLIQGKMESDTRFTVTISDVLQHIFVHDMKNDKELLHTIPAWSAHYSPRTHDVQAQVVRATPADGCTELSNMQDARQRIVIMERGNCPFLVKVENAEKAHALGVIIIDNTDKCKPASFSHFCSQGASKYNNQGFANHDNPTYWQHVKIPALLISKQHADNLLKT